MSSAGSFFPAAASSFILLILLWAPPVAGDTVGTDTRTCDADAKGNCTVAYQPAPAAARALLQQVATNRRGNRADEERAHGREHRRGLDSVRSDSDTTREEDGAWDFPAGAPAPAGMGLLAGAPNAHLVRKKIAKEQKMKEAAENGDLHYTVHGCHCHLNWTLGGVSQTGCSGHPDNDHSGGYPWCEVTTDCEHSQGTTEDGHIWDWCTNEDSEVDHHRTVHGCHCSPMWDYKDEMYNSCGRTSKGPKWCYVFEGDVMCPSALRTEHHGRHWDYCFSEDQASKYLTRHGCHCMPEWPLDEEMKAGCTAVEADGAVIQGCIVLEDSCYGAKRMENTSHWFDECTVPAGTHAAEDEFVKEWPVAQDDGCYCQPKWTYRGKEYSDCAKPEGSTRGWCFLLTDERACEKADGHATEGEEKGQRWKYCEPPPNATTAAPEPEDNGGVRVVAVIIPQASSTELAGVPTEAAEGEGAGHAEHGTAPDEEGAKSAGRRLAACAAALAIALLVNYNA